MMAGMHTITHMDTIVKASQLPDRKGTVTPGCQSLPLHFLAPSVSLPLNIPTWLLHEYKEVTLPHRIGGPEGTSPSLADELPVIIAVM